MRVVFAAFTALALFAGPALADDAADLATAKAAIAAANLSDASALDMWCGAAYTLISQQYKQAGKADDAKTNDDNATAVFTKAAASLTTDGVKDADMAGLSTDFMAVVFSEISTTPATPEHTEDDCKGVLAQ
jgi:hypothetical protein